MVNITIAKYFVTMSVSLVLGPLTLIDPLIFIGHHTVALALLAAHSFGLTPVHTVFIVHHDKSVRLLDLCEIKFIRHHFVILIKL